MSYFFTSESVSEGHPDKVADQISDALLDNFLAFDPSSKVACETLVTTGQVILAGEVKSKTYIDVQKIARETIKKIGYTKGEYMFESNSCGVLSSIHEQSPDINQGVERNNPVDQGAGDQGMMFGYATDETPNFMPLSLDLSHKLVQGLSQIRKNQNHLMPYLRPDAKSQVTIEYNDANEPVRIKDIVISTQHDPFLEDEKAMQSKIQSDILQHLIPAVMKTYDAKIQKLLDDKVKYHVNPTGKFVIGGPHGDTGLTGRKIIVDTYGGKGAHGGGAFSGKDPSKVDRSAAYATRHIAKNMVAAGVCKEILVQVSYAIGEAEPMGIYVNTFGTNQTKFSDSELAQKISEIFDMRPAAIENRLQLRQPIYAETASYGHMGRDPQRITKTFDNTDGTSKTMEVELFTWEKLDFVDRIKTILSL